MNLSSITDELFIGTTPSADDYNHLREPGPSLVINMHLEYCPRILKFANQWNSRKQSLYNYESR
ncbi:MAG: hypothetical protein JNM02_07840 [Anaerolineales bacterium]|nr:hypothetical protein [Anaerolineales bacterium]